MQTPQKIRAAKFIPELIHFYRDHATDKKLKTRQALLSIHDERFTPVCAGSGRVWSVAIPYLEGEEPVPDDYGCLHVSHNLVDVALVLIASNDGELGRHILTVTLR